MGPGIVQQRGYDGACTVLAVLLFMPAGIINKPVTLYFSRLKEQFVAIDKTIFYLSLTKCDLLPVRI